MYFESWGLPGLSDRPMTKVEKKDYDKRRRRDAFLRFRTFVTKRIVPTTLVICGIVGAAAGVIALFR